MNLDFSSLTDIGVLLPILISLGVLIVMIISLRKKTPQPIVNVIQKSKEPDSGLGLLLIGGLLGFLIGRSLNDGDDKE